jgi:hypothetical protein
VGQTILSSAILRPLEVELHLQLNNALAGLILRDAELRITL